MQQVLFSNFILFFCSSCCGQPFPSFTVFFQNSPAIAISSLQPFLQGFALWAVFYCFLLFPVMPCHKLFIAALGLSKASCHHFSLKLRTFFSVYIAGVRCEILLKGTGLCFSVSQIVCCMKTPWTLVAMNWELSFPTPYKHWCCSWPCSNLPFLLIHLVSFILLE